MTPGDDATAARNADFAATFVDELARSGVGHVIVAPGSRSAPLALAALRHPALRTTVVVDERSAAFTAVGIGKATGAPAAVICTSGTAAANLLPAVVEAHHSRAPLLVLTADRPPELHGTGAPQTIDQVHLFGRAVRRFLDPGPPADDVEGGAAAWRSLAATAVLAATGAEPGPVHCNLAFREPLVAARVGDARAGRPGGAPWTARRGGAAADDDAVAALAAVAQRCRRGLIVAGVGAAAPSTAAGVANAVDAFAAAAGWPVLADAVSGLRRGPHAIATYDLLVTSDGFGSEHVPDAVVRLGGPPTSKPLTQWLAALDPGVPVVLVDPWDAGLDPTRAASVRLVADPGLLLTRAAARLARDGHPTDPLWSASWHRADAAVRRFVDAVLDAGDCDEGRVARDVVAAAPAGAVVAVASSMPVRDADLFAAPRDGVTFLTNRGANGIDGFTSTVAGAALATGRTAVALLGDLCFLHDLHGVRVAVAEGVDAVFVVVDNDGGGIFSFLPQAEVTAPAEFEAVFGTPHGLDLVELARALGVARAARCTPAEVAANVAGACSAGGVHVLVVPSDRAANVRAHRDLRARVASVHLPPRNAG